MNTGARIKPALGAVLPFLAPMPAFAAESVGNVSLLGSFIQMIASLAVVIGVIYLFSYATNRWLRNGPSGGAQRYIRLVETRHIGPKKSLMLVEVGGEYLLLGSSPEGVQLIKQVDMLEEIEVVGSPESMRGGAACGEKFREMLAKMSGEILRRPPSAEPMTSPIPAVQREP